MRINSNLSQEDAERVYEDINLSLDNEDLGQDFYKKIQDQSNIKLIDFSNIKANDFHVVTELTYKNGDDEFRPDITLLVNGMPLVFIEVKKPNNRDGIIAERQRINARFQNSKLKKFINITQFMIFSNNMEYDDEDPEPIQGAFYASSSYKKPIFNYFREEEKFDYDHILTSITEDEELMLLKDNNLEVIKSNPEYISNKEPSRPTNRICTSLCSPDRLFFILRYGLAYVSEKNGIEKHIMRYPQIFATKAIEKKLDSGVKKGIVWHTQGSGKTALSYYNVRFLTDYFQQNKIIPKFYFVVDRLDLLQQAQTEFSSRGLKVYTINSRDEFASNIKSNAVINNDTGKPEITVVNIQKFKDDPDVVSVKDYDLNIQRVYFLDEVHRSYNPKGSFLANLIQSDTNAIKIGLTGTPLLSKDAKSTALFGNYIHKYYYNASIADGYTLRLIREEIATNYKIELQKALEEVEVQMGDVDRKDIYAHSKFVEPMLDYIVTDFEKSRNALNDDSIGGMVICDSADQAKEIFDQFNQYYAEKAILPDKIENFDFSDRQNQKKESSIKSAAIILHDIGTKDERKEWVEDFKAGKIDFLFVYNMLLTGFDAKRLKKLYLGRIIRKHNLLQALTRVNRTYKDFRYGYVVDFADIQKEFEATNQDYFRELQDELGDELENYSKLFKSQEEIKEEIENIKDQLFRYNIDNAEIFADQISQISNRDTMLSLKKALSDARSLYNLIRLQGDYEFLKELDFEKLNALYREASNHLDLLNLKENLEKGSDTTNLLNVALEDVVFKFTKIGESELVLADKLKNTLRQTREALASNFDQQDPEFIKLKEELERLFKKKNLTEVTQEEMNANIGALNKIHYQVKELNRENNQICQKYNSDKKYARIHKRLTENGKISDSERLIFQALINVKNDADEKVLNNSQILNNESYFERQMRPSVLNRFMTEEGIELNSDAVKYINHLIVKEYLTEFNNGTRTW